MREPVNYCWDRVVVNAAVRVVTHILVLVSSCSSSLPPPNTSVVCVTLSHWRRCFVCAYCKAFSFPLTLIIRAALRRSALICIRQAGVCVHVAAQVIHSRLLYTPVYFYFSPEYQIRINQSARISRRPKGCESSDSLPEHEARWKVPGIVELCLSQHNSNTTAICVGAMSGVLAQRHVTV